MSEVVIPGIVVMDSIKGVPLPKTRVWSTRADEPVQGVRVPRAVVSNRLTDVPTIVMNILRTPIMLRPNTAVATLKRSMLLPGACQGDTMESDTAEDSTEVKYAMQQ